ncbi:ORC2-domain-containing protein [Glonium stellatum]|uniref:Origin recognition complex subunit 2 n=1 Tax=Glonium stellatum TaxID=574774 RepID=A0A8E2FD82_9PEZI|nr:ORC2-domain-containing protein [Glonium stellatum]
MKRKRTEDDPGTPTPRKTRAQALNEDDLEDDITLGTSEVETPSKRKRGDQPLARGIHYGKVNRNAEISKNGINGPGTPRSQRRVLFSTPTKSRQEESTNGTPTIVRNADRSARRKSARRLIERTINGDESDEEVLDEEDTLAQQILGEDEDDEDEDLDQEGSPTPETPSKRGRGRPKGRSQKRRSPTPPQHLPPHELYFWQNRPGGSKTSNNTLPSRALLNHDEYFKTMQSYEDPHDPEKEVLLELHSRAFDQWIFELGEDFNICLYGYGSKRPLTQNFAAHLYEHLSTKPPYSKSKQTPKIIVVNGYTPSITIKDIFITIASTILPSAAKLPTQPTAFLSYLLNHLTENPPPHPIPFILNSIDSPSLRRAPTPAFLAQLAAHPSISLLCTADTPNFPLLWDLGQRAQFKFLFHDATTFAPYDAEIDVVESVNELLGRSGRRVGGRDGVGFVLRSLPENARALFRILVTEQLALLSLDSHADIGEDDGVGGGEAEFGATATPRHRTNPARRRPAHEAAGGVEYRVLYHKAVEEFVCSNEVGFRTLLKEFHDHQMVESRKDGMGTERLWVPFRREELEGLGEELGSEGF